MCTEIYLKEVEFYEEVASWNSTLIASLKHLKFDQIGVGLKNVDFDFQYDLEEGLDLVSWWKYDLGLGFGYLILI